MRLPGASHAASGPTKLVGDLEAAEEWVAERGTVDEVLLTAVDGLRSAGVDDSESKLAGAIEIGMTAHLFEGVPGFRRHLASAGLPVLA